jgi:hypothetical protein
VQALLELAAQRGAGPSSRTAVQVAHQKTHDWRPVVTISKPTVSRPPPSAGGSRMRPTGSGRSNFETLTLVCSECVAGTVCAMSSVGAGAGASSPPAPARASASATLRTSHTATSCSAACSAAAAAAPGAAEGWPSVTRKRPQALKSSAAVPAACGLSIMASAAPEAASQKMTLLSAPVQAVASRRRSGERPEACTGPRWPRSSVGGGAPPAPAAATGASTPVLPAT